MRTGRKRERGSSLPETAIVMAVLLGMICGIIDFGRAIYTYGFVAQLARQGARWAIVRGSQCTLLTDCNATSAEVQTYVQSLAYGFITPSSVAATATWPAAGCPPGSSGNAPGCNVEVTVTYPFKFALPWMPTSLGTLNLTSTSEMVISQ
ncbi:MAG: TadE/TadG family type IV pilus assembly protein [Candidatus Cybelea sp.]|jgi:Flp pilus assembly protein TadG